MGVQWMAESLPAWGMWAGAMIWVMLTWLQWAAVLMGWGWILIAIFKVDATRPRTWVLAFWNGLASILMLLQIWHLFLPVNRMAWGVIVAVGIGALIGQRKMIARLQGELPGRSRRILGWAGVAVVCWMANRACGPGDFYDAGLYHLQAVQWMQQYAIVPGLANLHLRLGFNNSIHLFYAVLDQGIWAQRAGHLVNGMLVGMLGLMVTGAMVRICQTQRVRAVDCLTMFLGIAVVAWGVNPQVCSVAADLGSVVVMLVAAICFVEMFEADTQTNQRDYLAFSTVLLAAAAVSIKISCLGLAGLICVLAIGAWWWGRNGGTGRIKTAMLLVVCPLLLVGVWLLRNIILTGYPLYPLERWGFPVDWRVPLPTVKWLHEIFWNWVVHNWFDAPGASAQWLGTWFKTKILVHTSLWFGLGPFAGGTVALLVALGRWGRLRQLGREWVAVWLLLGATAVAIWPWVSVSPDPRYGSHLLFLWGGCGGALLAGTWLTPGGGRKWITILVLAWCVLPAVDYFGIQGAKLKHRINAVITWPGDDWGMHPLPAVPAMRIFTTNSGFSYFTPVKGDQLWLAPLPNSPEQPADLHLRVPGNIQSGFARNPEGVAPPPYPPGLK